LASEKTFPKYSEMNDFAHEKSSTSSFSCIKKNIFRKTTLGYPTSRKTILEKLLLATLHQEKHFWKNYSRLHYIKKNIFRKTTLGYPTSRKTFSEKLLWGEKVLLLVEVCLFSKSHSWDNGGYIL